MYRLKKGWLNGILWLNLLLFMLTTLAADFDDAFVGVLKMYFTLKSNSFSVFLMI